jgi:hypothetical protein
MSRQLLRQAAQLSAAAWPRTRPPSSRPYIVDQIIIALILVTAHAVASASVAVLPGYRLDGEPGRHAFAGGPLARSTA